LARNCTHISWRGVARIEMNLTAVYSRGEVKESHINIGDARTKYTRFLLVRIASPKMHGPVRRYCKAKGSTQSNVTLIGMINKLKSD